MDYVEVRYGGKGLYSGLVYLTGSLTLRNATLTESYSTGLYRYSGSGAVTVEQSSIRNNASSGIYLSGSGTPSITSSTIQGNSAYGVYVSATNHAYINGNTFSGNGSTAVYVMAGNPAWNGQVTGNTFQTSASNPVTVNFASGGLAATSDLGGNTFTGNVRNGIDLQGTMLLDSSLRPATYIVQSTLTVGSSSVRPTLTIQPHTVVKFNVQQRMDVYGTLSAVGTTTSRIHFTALRDDTVGGDTNNDGSTTSPYNGYWSTVRSYAGGTVNLQYATVRYGGYLYGSLRVEGGVLELRDSELTNSTTAGISHASGTAPVVISGNTIADNSNYALNLAAAASPSISGNTFRNHTADGALYVAAAATPSVTGNTFENNRYGLYINAGSPAWSGTVANNTFTGHTTSPIYIYFNAGGLAGTANLSGNSFTNNAYNGVTLNGTVSVSTALPAGPTYVLSSTQSLTVASGATLTLNSGTVLKLGAGRYISVTGTLQGRGTQESQAYITALTDDTAGGDTNNDGSATTTARGYWGYIYTTGASTIDLQHTTVRYGGLNMVGTGMVRGYGAGGTITLANSTLEESSEYGLGIENATTLTISGSTVRSNSGGGAILKAASPTSITGSTFSGNGGAGLRANAGSDPAVTGNTFSANTGAGVWVLTGSSAWAGTVTGNNFQANGSAMDLYFEGGGLAAGADISGNTWSDNNYNGIYTYGTIGLNTRLQGGNVYVLNSTFEISSAAALTLDPGAIVKIGPQNPGFRVYGSLSAVGTAENPVVFTAIPDDSAGGDTNNDGATTVPVPDYWDRIAIYAGGAATIEQAEVRYGGWSAGWGAITVEGGGLTLRNSKVHNNSLGVVFQTRGAYVLEGNSFSGNTNYAVWVADTQNGAIDARYNYWGHDSGPRPYGTGDAYRQDYVLVNPWTGKDYWYARHAGLDPTSPPIQHVNAVLGSYTRTYTDLATHDGIGPRVSIIRTYNSFDESPGPLGPGWSLNWEAGLAFFDGGATIVASYGDGKQTRFMRQTGGMYTADTGDYNQLTLVGATYDLTTPDRSVYRYNAGGQLTSMSDRNGNTVTLSYDPGTGHLTGIQDAAGRSFILGWTSGRLTSVTDALTRQVQYGYDASGRLQTVTTNRGTVTYTYDGASARVATITNELSQAEATLTYDSDFRVATQTDAETRTTTYTYDIVNRTVRIRAPGAAADTQVEYDTRLRRVLHIDPVGRRWQYSFDDNNNPTGETDPW